MTNMQAVHLTVKQVVMTGVLANHVQTSVDAAVPQLCAVSNNSVQWQRAISTGEELICVFWREKYFGGKTNTYQHVLLGS